MKNGWSKVSFETALMGPGGQYTGTIDGLVHLGGLAIARNQDQGNKWMIYHWPSGKTLLKSYRLQREAKAVVEAISKLGIQWMKNAPCVVDQVAEIGGVDRLKELAKEALAEVKAK